MYDESTQTASESVLRMSGRHILGDQSLYYFCNRLHNINSTLSIAGGGKSTGRHQMLQLEVPVIELTIEAGNPALVRAAIEGHQDIDRGACPNFSTATVGVFFRGQKD